MAQLTSDKRTQQLELKYPDKTHVTREFNQIMLKSDPGKVSDLITTILILIIFIAMSTIKILVSKNF